MADTKQKADALVEKFKDYVTGYIGSSMLSNTEYPEQIERQATRVAILSTKNTIKVLGKIGTNDRDWMTKDNIKYRIDEQTEILKELEGRV